MLSIEIIGNEVKINILFMFKTNMKEDNRITKLNTTHKLGIKD